MKLAKLLSGALLATVLSAQSASAADTAQVIEVATFQLAAGVTAEQFAPIDKQVELEHVARQPGFISRETAAGDQGEWLVIVHWRSIADAEASMASFANAPAAAPFMARLDASTMRMKRYNK